MWTLTWREEDGHVYKVSIEEDYMELRMTELSKSDTILSLFPMCFMFHTLLHQIILHAVWFVLIFLRVLYSVGQELGHT